jgi:Reductase C-terminal
VPFFWSQHYDVPINYVGRHRRWDEIVIDGDITAKDCLLEYKRKGRLLAVASIFRDLASLQAEVKMEREATWRAGSHYLSCANNVPARKPSPSTACWSKCARKPPIGVQL